MNEQERNLMSDLVALDLKSQFEKDPHQGVIYGNEINALLQQHYPVLLTLIQRQERELSAVRQERDDRDQIIEILKSCTRGFPVTLTDLMDEDDRDFYNRFNEEEEEEEEANQHPESQTNDKRSVILDTLDFNDGETSELDVLRAENDSLNLQIRDWQAKAQALEADNNRLLSACRDYSENLTRMHQSRDNARAGYDALSQLLEGVKDSLQTAFEGIKVRATIHGPVREAILANLKKGLDLLNLEDQVDRDESWLEADALKQRMEAAKEALGQIYWNLCTESLCEGYCYGCQAKDLIAKAVRLISGDAVEDEHVN